MQELQGRWLMPSAESFRSLMRDREVLADGFLVEKFRALVETGRRSHVGDIVAFCSGCEIAYAVSSILIQCFSGALERTPSPEAPPRSPFVSVFSALKTGSVSLSRGEDEYGEAV